VVGQIIKKGAKPVAKPQWRVPQLPKPAVRDAFKPAMHDLNTWTTFDAAVKVSLHFVKF
jgi:hypothetical protein